MSILQKYTLRELAGPLALGLAVFTFVFLIGRMFQILDRLLNSGVSALLLGEFILSLMPFILSLTVPMGILVAILLGIGRLAADHEILAIRMSGVNLLHICIPIIVVAGLITAGMIWANQRLVPYLNLKSSDLQTQIEFNMYSAIPADRFFPLEGGRGKPSITFFYDERDTATGQMHSVNIRTEVEAKETEKEKQRREQLQAQLKKVAKKDDEKSKAEAQKLYGQLRKMRNVRKTNEALIVAQGGHVTPDIDERLVTINLTTGSMHVVDPGSPEQYNVVRFASMTKAIRPSFQRTEEGVYKKNAREMSTAELRAKIKERRRIDKYVVELYRRHSVPFACIAFALVAIPLAIYVRPTGKAIAFAIAFFVILLYYGLLEYGVSLGENGSKLTPIAIFFPNVLLSLIGSVLLYRMVMK